MIADGMPTSGDLAEREPGFAACGERERAGVLCPGVHRDDVLSFICLFV